MIVHRRSSSIKSIHARLKIWMWMGAELGIASWCGTVSLVLKWVRYLLEKFIREEDGKIDEYSRFHIKPRRNLGAKVDSASTESQAFVKDYTTLFFCLSKVNF